MPEGLRADLELNLADALRAVDDLRDSVEEALRGAAGAFEEEFSRVTGALPPVEVEVESDADQLGPAIEESVSGADTTVPIDGEGFEQLTIGIDEAIAASDPVVTVEADVSEAEAAIESLGSTASSTGAEVSSLSGGLGAGGLSGASGLAEGSVSGLGAAVGGLGGKAAASVGIIGAVAGTVGIFFNEAVDALGATQRFDGVLGGMANRVEELRNIEGLNTNLGDLALKLGSDDDKVRTVAARLFELARSSGVAKDDASLFTQQMVAMGARAVALNPELGDMGDVTDSLSSAFVRGGKFAAKYGLDLNQNLITERAIEATGKLETELTFVDKAMAGAALASEKYGGNLDKVIAEGSENAITKQRRLKQTIVENFEALGAPLIAPIFELMEDSIPIVEDVGRVVAALARGTLPILIAALEVAAPILQVVADVLELIPSPVLAIVAAMLLFRGSVGPGVTFMQSFGTAALSTSDKMGRAVLGLGLLKMGFDQAGEGGVKGAMGIASMAAGGAALGSVIPGVGTGLGALAGGAVGVGKALLSGGESADEFRQRISDLSKELTGLSNQKAALTFIRQVDDALTVDFDKGKVGFNIANIRKELEQLARTDPGNAARVLEGLANDKGLDLTAGQVAKLRDAVDEGGQAFGRQTDKARAAAEANKEIAAAADTSTSAYDRLRASTDLYRASLEQLDAGHTSAFQAETALATATLGLEAAFTEAKGSTDKYTESGQANREALAGAANDARTYSAAILEAGGTTEAARAPLTGLATQVTDLATRFGAAPADVASLLSSLGLLSFASPEVQAQAKAMGLSISDDIGGKSEDAAARTAAAMAGAKGSIEGAGLGAAAGAQGRDVLDEYGNPVATGIPAVTATAITAAGGVLDRGALKDAARGAGHAVGRAFGEGMEDGLYAREGDIDTAARYIVSSALQAARNEAQAKSPSRLWAELGRDLDAGMAGGMDAGAGDVIRAAEDIVRAAANAAVPPPAAAARSGVDPAAIGREVARALVQAGVGAGGFTIQSAQFGDRGVLSDLDYFWRTRMAGG